jgi:Na+/H+ antiporter NhaD/arsenite permease-like protein
VMVRWLVSFAVVLVLFCVLYYLVRLRPIPEDEIKERRHDAAEPPPGRT